MTSSLSEQPDDDSTFDLFDAQLGKAIKAAGIELLRFRDRRECEGTA